jgi:Spy/CpxP family protein refolding chaperone
LGTQLSSKLCFAAAEQTEFAKQGHSQTEFGNEKREFEQRQLSRSTNFFLLHRNFRGLVGFAFPQGDRGKRGAEERKEKTMKSRLITLGAACVALFATVTLGQAQDPAAKNNDRPNRWHHKRGNPVEHLTKALDLTPEQQAKIQPIFDQAKPQLKAARQEAKQKVQAIRENIQSQIRPILTPAQQQKFDAMKKAREDMRKARDEMRDAVKQ